MSWTASKSGFLYLFHIKNKIQAICLHARYMVDKVKSLYFALSFWYIEPQGGELVCLTSKTRVRVPYVPHGTVAQMVSSRRSEKPKIGGSSPLCSTVLI